jgi:hypothetical protein
MSKLGAGWLRWLIALAPVSVPIFIILRWGVDVHFWDEWDPDLAGLFIKSHDGTLTLADFFAQHNEHRPAVPRLIFFLLNSFTHWNNIAYLMTACAIVAATSLAVLLLLRRTMGKSQESWFIWFLCNLLIFSPNQDQTWLWGIGIQNVLPTALFLFAILIVLSGLSPWIKLIFCGLLCSAATFSSGSGFLTWPLIAFLFVYSKQWRQSLVLLALGGLIAVGYFYHYARPTFGGVPGDRGTPEQRVGFFVAFFGNIFSTALPGIGQTVSLICGSVILAIFLGVVGFLFYARREKMAEVQTRLLPWFVLAGFALLSGVLAARGRAGFGIPQALESRYASSSLYLALALVAMTPVICGALRWRSAPPILAGLLVVLQLMSFPGALAACGEWSDSQRGVKAAVLLIRILPHNPQLEKVFPSPEILVREAEQLNRMGYLHPPLITSADAELIEGSNPSPRGEIVAIRKLPNGVEIVGWAISQVRHRPAGAVFITYQKRGGRPVICELADMGVRAQSVVDHLHDAGYLWSGWSAIVPDEDLPRGSGPITLHAWVLGTQTGRAYLLDGGCVLDR